MHHAKNKRDDAFERSGELWAIYLKRAQEVTSERTHYPGRFQDPADDAEINAAYKAATSMFQEFKLWRDVVRRMQG